MAIIINIDVMLAERKTSVTGLAGKVGTTMANISILKNERAKAIRLSTLEAICKALECQPGDILEYKRNNRIKNLPPKKNSKSSFPLRFPPSLFSFSRAGKARRAEGGGIPRAEPGVPFGYFQTDTARISR